MYCLQGRPLNFLHLDDHALFAEGLMALLQQKIPGLSYTTVANTEAALMHLEIGQAPDLILIDLMMPGLDGLAFIESLKRRKLVIPFIVLSASHDLWDIRDAMSQGAGAFIPKTTSGDEILAIIESVLAGEVYLPESIQQALAQLPTTKPASNQQKLIAAYQLGPRQMDVLRLMQNGYSTDEIAAVLHLSRNTIKSHTRSIFAAFSVKNRLECVRYAERRGILS